MLELIQLTEAVLIATAVTLSVVATPVVIINGDEAPDLQPLLESVEEITK